MEGPDEPETAIPGETEPVHAEEDAVAPVETTKKDDSLLTVDQARDRLESKLQHSSNSNEDNKDALLFDSIQLILKDHDHLKEKVGKLKSLLGRSAKAQRETKVEMDATQKRLDQALAEVQKLQQKMEKLSNRPSHMVRLLCLSIHSTGVFFRLRSVVTRMCSSSSCCFVSMNEFYRNYWPTLKPTLIGRY
jgi:hypothetical protein